MLDFNNNAYLTDLGSIRKMNILIKSKSKVITTYHYAPPELLRYEPQTESDIWSLGCLIHEIFTGK